MNTADFLVALCVALALTGYFGCRRFAINPWIFLTENHFWRTVATAERPLVVLAARGFFRKRICYIHPRDGLMFYTWTRPDRLPEGVVLVPAAEGFGK